MKKITFIVVAVSYPEFSFEGDHGVLTLATDALDEKEAKEIAIKEWSDQLYSKDEMIVYKPDDIPFVSRLDEDDK